MSLSQLGPRSPGDKTSISSLLNPTDNIQSSPHRSNGHASPSHPALQRASSYSSPLSQITGHSPTPHLTPSRDHYTPFREYTAPQPSLQNTSSYRSPSMSFRRPPVYPDASRGIIRDDLHGPEAKSYPNQSYYRNGNRSLDMPLIHPPSPDADDYRQLGYPEHADIPNEASNLQTTERASIRLAARGTTQPYPYSHLPEFTANTHNSTNGPPAPTASVDASSGTESPPDSPLDTRDSPEVLPAHLRRKRSHDALPERAKRAKTTTTAKPRSVKEKAENAASKRAKKRTAPSAGDSPTIEVMPKISYNQLMTDKGKGKALNTRTEIAAGTIAYPELQTTRCMSQKVKDLSVPKCLSCTRRYAGDICRFQNIRYLLRDQNNDFLGISFLDKHKDPPLHFPDNWNVPMRPEHLQRTKRTIAPSLLPALRLEAEHQKHDDLIYRYRENGVRTTCDVCMTSIFAASWMCRLCGREICADCYAEVKLLTSIPRGASAAERAAFQHKLEKHAHSKPFFFQCTKKHDHVAEDFSPMSRFSSEQLATAIKDMEALELAAAHREGAEEPCPIIDETGPPTRSNQSASTSSSSDVGHGVNGSNSNIFISKLSSVPSLVIQRIPHTELTDDAFRSIWEKGHPLVVTDVLDNFNIKWTPEYFAEKYAKVPCVILQCQTESSMHSTVGAFFRMFASQEDRKGDVWKLKDWPPSADFKSEYPELFEDFSNAVPVPNYVRRDGVLNIASHFPDNAVPPDIGPKMYNAMGSSPVAGSKGSTRLHMDMADALNVMTYAGPLPDGSPGCAAWDLYPAEDSDKIRRFLKGHATQKAREAAELASSIAARSPGAAGPDAVETVVSANIAGQGAAADPIHSQLYYVDEAMRKELYENYGVRSWRVYQYPGEAVFIPAGCAHQVCNLADCIKVAVDFVSPENVTRCEKLTQEFRAQNQNHAWKEDVLQLRSMMWYAWLSCQRQEEQQRAASA